MCPAVQPVEALMGSRRAFHPQPCPYRHPRKLCLARGGFQQLYVEPFQALRSVAKGGLRDLL